MTGQLGFDLEAQAREEAFDRMEASEIRAHYLRLIRKEMRRRALRGVRVNPDHARTYFESLNPPGPEELSRNFLGCVFRGKEWVWAGTYRSQTTGSHGNRLNEYEIRGGTQ